MATRRTPLGETEPVVLSSEPQPTTVRRTTSSQPPTGIGLLVAMRSIDDLTDPDVLETPFYFQCPPLDSFVVSYSHGFNTFQTLRKGEMLAPQGHLLTTINFRTLFLAYNAPWTFEVARPNPLTATRRLRRILNTGTPFALTVSNRGLWDRPDVAWNPKHGNAAVLTSLDVEEVSGEEDSRYVNVSFQEYREPKLARRRRGGGGSRGRKLPAVIKIDNKTGDWKRTDPGHPRSGEDATLRKLAKQFYGEQRHWRHIVGHEKNGRLRKVGPGENIGKALKGKDPITVHIPKAPPSPPKASINRPARSGNFPGGIEED